MIVGKDIHPEKEIYYLGALLLEVINDANEKDYDFLDLFHKLNFTKKVSINLFTSTLDWLFLLGVIEQSKGRIYKCL
ncbi:MAG: hypothetical protein H6755_07835 [Candidatus Omnitrophica bacterium]|nr:hypothetical protein [Candidatus Omnitrophota bacterium]